MRDGVVGGLVTNGWVGRPAFSPDGRQLAYCSKGPDVEIYTQGLSGVPVANRTNNAGHDCAPDWQRPVNPQLDFEATGMGLFAGIDYGQTSNLSGRLTAGGQPVVDKAITLEQRPFSAPLPLSSGWTAIPGANVRTSTNGTFNFYGFRPDRNVFLRLGLRGTHL